MEVSRVRLTTVEASLGFMNSSTPSPIPTMNNIRKYATGSAAISIPRPSLLRKLIGSSLPTGVAPALPRINRFLQLRSPAENTRSTRKQTLRQEEEPPRSLWRLQAKGCDVSCRATNQVGLPENRQSARNQGQ